MGLDSLDGSPLPHKREITEMIFDKAGTGTGRDASGSGSVDKSSASGSSDSSGVQAYLTRTLGLTLGGTPPSGSGVRTITGTGWHSDAYSRVQNSITPPSSPDSPPDSPSIENMPLPKPLFVRASVTNTKSPVEVVSVPVPVVTVAATTKTRAHPAAAASHVDAHAHAGNMYMFLNPLSDSDDDSADEKENKNRKNKRKKKKKKKKNEDTHSVATLSTDSISKDDSVTTTGSQDADLSGNSDMDNSSEGPVQAPGTHHREAADVDLGDSGSGGESEGESGSMSGSTKSLKSTSIADYYVDGDNQDDYDAEEDEYVHPTIDTHMYRRDQDTNNRSRRQNDGSSCLMSEISIATKIPFTIAATEEEYALGPARAGAALQLYVDADSSVGSVGMSAMRARKKKAQQQRRHEEQHQSMLHGAVNDGEGEAQEEDEEEEEELSYAEEDILSLASFTLLTPVVAPPPMLKGLVLNSAGDIKWGQDVAMAKDKEPPLKPSRGRLSLSPSVSESSSPSQASSPHATIKAKSNPGSSMQNESLVVEDEEDKETKELSVNTRRLRAALLVAQGIVSRTKQYRLQSGYDRD